MNMAYLEFIHSKKFWNVPVSKNVAIEKKNIIESMLYGVLMCISVLSNHLTNLASFLNQQLNAAIFMSFN
jgi:hypothetical protein